MTISGGALHEIHPHTPQIRLACPSGEGNGCLPGISALAEPQKIRGKHLGTCSPDRQRARGGRLFMKSTEERFGFIFFDCVALVYLIAFEMIWEVLK
jgi:hypothetical protein